MQIRIKQPKKSRKVTQVDKTKFRRSAEWHKLRDKIKKQQKLDPITLKPLSRTYNLHHLNVDPQKYTVLDEPDHFIGLNSTTHTLVHFLWGDASKRKDWRSMVLRLIKILKLMDKFYSGGLIIDKTEDV